MRLAFTFSPTSIFHRQDISFFRPSLWIINYKISWRNRLFGFDVPSVGLSRVCNLLPLDEWDVYIALNFNSNTKIYKKFQICAHTTQGFMHSRTFVSELNVYMSEYSWFIFIKLHEPVKDYERAVFSQSLHSVMNTPIYRCNKYSAVHKKCSTKIL